jgi:hypothetical protein
VTALEVAITSPLKETNEDTPSPIKRPSLFLNQVSTCIYVLKSLLLHSKSTSSYKDFIFLSVEDDVDFVLGEVLHEQMTTAMHDNNEVTLPRPSTALKAKQKKSASPTTSAFQKLSFVGAYVNWYTDLLRDRATQGSLILCTLKKSLVSSNFTSFKAQQYADFSGTQS